MVNNQVHWLQRVDERGIATEPAHGISHGGKVDNGGHAGEVLQQNSGRTERNLVFGLGLGVPGGERQNIFTFDRAIVLVPKQVLKQDLE